MKKIPASRSLQALNDALAVAGEAFAGEITVLT